MSRDELLTTQRHVANFGIFERGKNRIAATDELMQAERERSGFGFGVRFAFVTCEQPSMDRVRTEALVDVNDLTEGFCDSLITPNRFRLCSLEPRPFGIGLQS